MPTHAELNRANQSRVRPMPPPTQNVSGANTPSQAAMAAPLLPLEPPARVGIVNQGCTCYLNSLLQALYHLAYFRAAVFKSNATLSIPSSAAPPGSGGSSAAPPAAASAPLTTQPSETTDNLIPAALQALFFHMQSRKTAVSTKGLTAAFEWDEREVFVQHDIQEMAALLRDSLETRAKGTPAEGDINLLFTGYGEKYFSTLDGSYTSRRPDTFYDVHVPVQGYSDLLTALQSLTVVEMLTGDNKYCVEESGKPNVYKDAETGYRFLRFPPVIFFHLKRFEMDMTSATLEMHKINTTLRFPNSLDLSELEKGFGSPDRVPEAMRRQLAFLPDSPPDYDLIGIVVHRGGVRSGHYFCYMREYNPDTKEFGHFVEFDDEHVRYVDEYVAVTKNFGGPVTVHIRGYDQQILSPQNAYMLVYGRRADLPVILSSVRTELIPAALRSTLSEQVAVEEALAVDDMARRRKVNVHLLRDGDIDAFVQRHSSELIPSSGDISSLKSVATLNLEKAMHWADFWDHVAEKIGTPRFRLWLFKSPPSNSNSSTSVAISQRPIVVLTRDAGRPEHVDDPPGSIMSVVLGPKAVDDGKRLMSFSFYLELEKDYASATVTNIAAGLQFQPSSVEPGKFTNPMGALRQFLFSFHQNDMNPTMAISVPNGAITITRITFRLARRYYQGTVQVAVFASKSAREPVAMIEVADRDGLDNNSPFNIVMPEHTRGSHIMIRRLSASRHPDNISVSRIQVHTVPADVGIVLDTEAHPPIRNGLPELDNGERLSVNMLVMVKYYNHVTGRMHFRGHAFLNPNELLSNNIRPLLVAAQLQDQITDYSALQVGMETVSHGIGQVLLLREDRFINDATQGHALPYNGTIIVLQQRPKLIPMHFACHTATEMMAMRWNQKAVNVRHLSTPDTVEVVILASENYNYVMTTEAIAKALILAAAAKSHASSVAGTAALLASTTTALESSSPTSSCDPGRSTLSPLLSAHVVALAKRIALHAVADFTSTSITPYPTAIRTDDNLKLRQMTQVHRFTGNDLFFNVLPIAREQHESLLKIRISVATETGEPVPRQVTAADGTTSSTTSTFFEFEMHESEATASVIVSRVLALAGIPFIRPYALLEIRHSLIQDFHEVVPDSGYSGPAKSALWMPYFTAPRSVRKWFRDPDSTYEVRPHHLGQPGEWLCAFSHGQFEHGKDNPPDAFGRPFFARLAIADTKPSTFAKMSVMAPLSAEEDMGMDECILLWVNRIFYFRSNIQELYQSMRDTCPSDLCNVRHLLINRRRPKEKPGSRYVAAQEHRLVIDRRSKRRGAGATTEETASGQGAAAGVSP